MQYLIRLRAWWVGQFRSTSRLGKAALILTPLLFVCCGLTMISALISPPDSEPAAEVASRAATAELPQAEPSEAPAATGEPTTAPTAADEPAATAEPTNTRPPRPTATAPVEPTATVAATATDEPTRPPVRAATAVAATVAASQPTAAPPTATNPPTPTAVPPTATPARVATVALPTAAPTALPPTVAPPTAVPATAVPPTAAPLPTATQPPVAAPGDVIIASVFYNGVVEQVESDEYAVITNRGAAVVNLSGWRLNAGEPDQNFYFPSFDLQPGQSCRVYTNEAHPESCGFSFGIGSAIWRNSGDCGTLHDTTGAEVSRYCWS